MKQATFYTTIIIILIIGILTMLLVSRLFDYDIYK
jgi:hypothetical protein